MTSKPILSASAVVLFIAGLALLFLPDEAAKTVFGAASGAAGSALQLQLLAAGYLGFAWLNWGARVGAVGGIFGRPVAVANFAHFAIGATVVARAQAGGAATDTGGAGWAIAAVYLAFAVAFGWLVFGATPRRPTAGAGG